MHLKRLTLENYGPIRSVELELQPRFNVIAGVNGAGKTTVLTALSIMLGRYSATVRTGRATGLLRREGIRKGARYTKASIIATDGANEFSWSAGASRRGPKVPGLTQSRDLIAHGTALADAIEGDPEQSSLPIVVAYSVNRAVLDIPLRIRTKVPFEQYAALDDTPFSGPRTFRTFFAWFRDREDVENEERAEGSRKRDPQLKAVRTAVEAMLDGFKDLRVRRQPLRMLITKDGVDFRVDQLSDGESRSAF